MGFSHNMLKAALAEGRLQRGVWLTLASAAAAEIAAGAGFDWCLIDAEHAPNELPGIVGQLRAMNGAAATPVVRVPIGETWIIKRVLDTGVQTVLVPMVETPEHARAMAAAMRYPPEGVRGMGASMARASGYGAAGDYVARANAEMCLIVQAESRKAIENIDEIAHVEGVDCVFIGPADLSADMGYPGNPRAPEVVAAIEHAVSRIRAAGKAAGVIYFDPDEALAWAARGVTFLGVGGDVAVLSNGLRALAQRTSGSGA